MSSPTMRPAICSKTVVFHAKIVPCDMTSYYVADERTLRTSLSDVLTREEYDCLENLLMKLVTKRDLNIDGNHTIDIIHSVEHQN